MTPAHPWLTLYSRSYCHLCQDMFDALQELCEQLNAAFILDKVQVIDVDTDPALVAQYDEKVPVLVAHENGVLEELCHYHLDTRTVSLFLTKKLGSLDTQSSSHPSSGTTS